MHRRYPWAWMALITLTALTGCKRDTITDSNLLRTPGAPTDVVVTAGDTEATVEWLAPRDPGSSPITGYEVTASPGELRVNASTLRATVTGLTNGTAYTFTVRALNALGAGPASAASSPVTPRGLPGAPLNVTATPGAGQVTVQWEAPASNGGSALTGYKVTVSPGDQTVSVDGATTSTTVTGLTNGTEYTFTVRALNAQGEGPAASPSSTIAPGTVPTTPVEVLATPGDGQAVLEWQDPGSDGGSPLTGYSVEIQPGDRTLTLEASTLSTTVTGLTNGTKYTLTVRATNAKGSSQGISVEVTPRTVPGVLASLILTANDEKISVSWMNPLDDGGSPITGFLVEASPLGSSATFGADIHDAELSGLVNGTEYTVTVRALNAAGQGLPTVKKGTPGLYRAPVTYPALDGQLARRMVTEDFNADGNMDVALCFPEAGKVGVLVGNGLGAFGAMQEIAVPNKPSALVASNFNGDDYMDLLVAGAAAQDDQRFIVLLGQAGGTFQAPSSAVAVAGITPRALVMGHFNIGVDDLMDLATVNEEGSVSILLGKGDGTFQLSSTITLDSGSFTFELTAGQLDPHFAEDLAVTMADGTHTLALLYGNGDGTFQAPQLLAVGAGTTCVKSAHLDMDFQADLLICDTDASTLASKVHVLSGQVDENMKVVFSLAGSYDAGQDVTDLVTGDFDSDMYVDFATAHNVNDWDVSVFRNQGDGTFPKVDRYMGDTFVHGIATASFNNGSGRADLALCGSRNVTVLLAR